MANTDILEPPFPCVDATLHKSQITGACQSEYAVSTVRLNLSTPYLMTQYLLNCHSYSLDFCARYSLCLLHFAERHVLWRRAVDVLDSLQC